MRGEQQWRARGRRTRDSYNGIYLDTGLNEGEIFTLAIPDTGDEGHGYAYYKLKRKDGRLRNRGCSGA